MPRFTLQRIHDNCCDSFQRKIDLLPTTYVLLAPRDRDLGGQYSYLHVPRVLMCRYGVSHLC